MVQALRAQLHLGYLNEGVHGGRRYTRGLWQGDLASASLLLQCAHMPPSLRAGPQIDGVRLLKDLDRAAFRRFAISSGGGSKGQGASGGGGDAKRPSTAVQRVSGAQAEGVGGVAVVAKRSRGGVTAKR